MATTGSILSNLNPSAGQSIRVNAGNTGWEAYTPGGGSSRPTQLGQYIGGNFYDVGLEASAANLASSYTVAADRMELIPFRPQVSLAIDQVGLIVTTTGGNAKVIIYSSDSNGWPDALIKETGNLSMGTAGPTYVSEAWSYTFNANTKYWIGFRSSAAGALRAVAQAWMPNLGRQNPATSTTDGFGALRRTLAYATAAPSTWTFTSTDLAAGVVTTANVLFRAA